MNVLTVNLLMSTLVFWIAVRIYVLPKLPELRPQSVMIPILLLHSMRHLGLMFLAPGATYPGMPQAFARPAAIGDLIAGLLAMTAILAILREAPSARTLILAFNVIGSVDLLTAITLATTHGAAEFMGPAYWIPAFWVPSLLVTHYLTFVVLSKRWPVAVRAHA